MSKPKKRKTPVAASTPCSASWMPIETAPKDGTKIKTMLTCLRGSIVSWWSGDYKGWHGWAITPSHWKPLNSKPNIDE